MNMQLDKFRCHCCELLHVLWSSRSFLSKILINANFTGLTNIATFIAFFRCFTACKLSLKVNVLPHYPTLPPILYSAPINSAV